MKLLILSDSHREMQYMRLAVKRERPDAVIHLGDYFRDADALAQEFLSLPVLSVRGNCDFWEQERSEVLLRTFEGVRVFGAHGHRYGVKQGLLRFELAAREQGAQIALFGHTHCAYCERVRGMWLLNPGACSGNAPSYGVVRIEQAELSCDIVDMFLNMEEKL